MRRARVFTALVMLAAAATAALPAQEPDEDAPARLDTVTFIANKSDRALGELAGTVSVLEREQIQRQLSRDIRDMVRYEPGVYVSRDAQRFGLGSFNIRGVEGNRVSMELDGVPVAQSFSVGSFASATRDWVDPDVLKRVEILRGPASTLFGSDALGGVVAYSTLDPADLMGYGETGIGVWSKASASSVDQGRVFSGALAGRYGAWEGMALGSARRASEVQNNAGVPGLEANPADSQGQNVLAKALYHFSPGNRLRLTLESSENDTATDVQSLVGAPGRFASTTSLLGQDDYRRQRISLDQDWELDAGALDRLRWHLFSQASDTLQETWQEQAPSGRVTYPSLRYRSFAMDQDAEGAELVLESSLHPAHGSHRLVYGAEWVAQQVKELRDGLETNLDTGESSNVIIGEELPVRDFPISTSRQLGLFVQDEISLGDGRVTLVPGLRHERFSMRPQADAMFEEDNPGVQPVSMDESNTAPRLGLVALLAPGLSGTLQYAEGFRAPPVEDVNIGFTIPAFNFVALPNPELKPETSRGLEAGLRYRGDRLSLGLTAFHNAYTNLIESRADQGVDPDTGLRVFQSVNRASATINGAEMRLGWEPELAALSGVWRVDLGLAYARGTDTQSGQPLNSINPLTGILGLAYEAPGAGWGARLVSTLVAGQDRLDRSSGDPFQAPGYGVLDLTAHLAFGRGLRLQAGIFNLGDKQYWSWNDVHGLVATDPSLAFYTAPGRNAALSLVYNLSR